jgi:glycosyltransferase involved in cell wall biosynthesis
MGAMVRTEHVPPQPPVGLRQRLQVRMRDRVFLAKVICVSSSNRDEHIRVLGRDPARLTVIPNGIDIDRFDGEDGRGVHAELGLAERVRLVGVVARLAEARKGIAEFLRMAATVVRHHADVHFVVVGDGPLRPSLEQLTADLGLGRRVTFLGSRDDVARVVAAMQIFVLPSLWEAGPLTLLEAMALGKAVVTTPVGVAPDVVTDEGNGLIVPAGDVDAMASAVGRLLGDDDLVARLGASARADARRSFSVDHMVDRTIALYASLMVRS